MRRKLIFLFFIVTTAMEYYLYMATTVPIRLNQVFPTLMRQQQCIRSGYGLTPNGNVSSRGKQIMCMGRVVDRGLGPHISASRRQTAWLGVGAIFIFPTALTPLATCAPILKSHD